MGGLSMGMQYDSNGIAGILPHRYPFALVDKIVDGEPGQWAKGVKCVTVNEPFSRAISRGNT